MDLYRQSKSNDTIAVILAAGKGRRIRSNLSKAMYKILGKPMIWRSAKLVENLGLDCLVVVGKQTNLFKSTLKEFPRTNIVSQHKKLGGGHALKTALKKINRQYNSLLELHGDSSAFFRPETISNLMREHNRGKATISILTTMLKRTNGGGVIIKDADGNVVKDIESSEKTYRNCEVNAGVFIYDLAWLRENIKQLKKDARTNEYMQTDLIEIASRQGKKIITVPLLNAWEKVHVNTQEQLKEANQLAIKYLLNNI